MASIVIAIPSFRRPRSLTRLLTALENLKTEVPVSVLVADNDGERHEAFNLCEKLRRNYRWPLEAIIVSERGISSARNALLEHAFADPEVEYVAALDDDEWPDPQWLGALLRVQRQTGAGVVQGSVLFEFEREPRPWAKRFDGMAHLRHATGPVDQIVGAGNLLIHRSSLAPLQQPYFDPAFALSGGEDSDFFLRLAQSGCRFAWADEAVARGLVPASRMSLASGLARSYRIGNSDMRVFLKHRPALGLRVFECAKTTAALLLSPLLLIMLVLSPNHAIDGLRRACRAAGKMAALCGRQYNGYSFTHGS